MDQHEQPLDTTNPATASNAATPADNQPNGSSGHETDGIIALVESQLEELRARIARETQSAAAEREQRERERNERTALAARLSEIESRAANMESELAEARKQVDEHVSAAAYLRREKAELLARLEGYEAASREHEAVVTKLRDVEAAASRYESELRAAGGALDQARAAVADIAKERDALQACIAEGERQFTGEREIAQQTSARLAQAEAAVTRLESELRAAADAIEQAKAAATQAVQERDAQQTKITEIEQRLAFERSAAQQNAAKLAEAEAAINRLETELGESRQAVEREQAAILTITRDRDEAKTRTRQVEDLLTDERAALKLERTQKQTVESERDGLAARLRDAQTAISRLESELRTAGEVIDRERAAALKTAEELSIIHARLRSAEEQLDREMTNAAYARREKAELEAKNAQHEQRIHELEDQLTEVTEESAARSNALDRERQQHDSTRQQFAELKETAARLESELQDTKAELEQQAPTIAYLRRENAEMTAKLEHMDAPAVDYDDLAERERTLREQLAQARAAEAAAKAAAKAAAETATKDLRDKARRINDAADHLQRRHARLAAIRKALKQGARPVATSRAAPTEDVESRMRAAAALEQERQVIADARQALAASERKMIRQWARPRAVISAGWLAMLVALCMGIGWITSGMFFSSMQSASVSIEPKTRAGESLDAETAARWAAWHAALPENEIFITSLSRRMGERRLANYNTTAKLRSAFKDSLTIDAGGDSVTYTLTSRNADEAAAALDLLASAVLVESNRQSATRGDGAQAVVRGASGSDSNRMRYATINPWPLDYRRPFAALVITGGLLIGLGVLVVTLFRRMSVMAGIFDQEAA